MREVGVLGEDVPASTRLAPWLVHALAASGRRHDGPPKVAPKRVSRHARPLARPGVAVGRGSLASRRAPRLISAGLAPLRR